MSKIDEATRLLNLAMWCGKDPNEDLFNQAIAFAESPSRELLRSGAIESNPYEQLNAIGRNQDAIQAQSSDNCPHCAGKPRKGTYLKPSTNKILYHAVCNDCGARTADCDTMDEAWTKWRARV